MNNNIYKNESVTKGSSPLILESGFRKLYTTSKSKEIDSLPKRFSGLTSDEYEKLGPNVLINSPFPEDQRWLYDPNFQRILSGKEDEQLITVRKSDIENLAISLTDVIKNSAYDRFSGFEKEYSINREIAESENFSDSIIESKINIDSKYTLRGYIHSSDFGIIIVFIFFGLSVISYFSGGNLVNPIVSLISIISGLVFYAMGRMSNKDHR